MAGSEFNILDPHLNLKSNYFIEASAGTGKTFTIENIVVKLIQEGIPLEKILVVTFTRAATLELKTRIRRNLERQKLKKEALCFDEAHIFTIHGFCFHTLKEYALQTGFALNANQESTSNSRLRHFFRDFLRTELTEDKIHPRQLEIVWKAVRYDPDALFKEIWQCQSTGSSFLESFRELNQEIQKFSQEPEKLLKSLLEEAPGFGKMCGRNKKIKPEIDVGFERFGQLLKGKQELWNLPITLMTPDNRLPSKGVYPKALEPLNQKLIPLLKNINDSNAIIANLSHSFRTFVKNICEKEDLFFYDDLLLKLHSQVYEPGFAALVRSQYEIVLIDEFQDTDPLQWEIFSTLFLGHLPLYLVGDPKQSIYRFRGANLYTYQDAKKALGADAHVTLSRNFRSDPPLVEALNLLFARTQDLITLPKTKESIPISPSLPALPNTQKGKFIFCRADDELSLFHFIYAEIERLNLETKLPLSSFAILVNDHYQAERFCKICPLPFATKKKESLKDSEAFSLLEDLLNCFCLPLERHKVAKLLAGPLFDTPLEACASSMDEAMQHFYGLQKVLKEEGLLSFFVTFSKSASFTSRRIYLHLLQLIEYLATEVDSYEHILPAFTKLCREDADSEVFESRSTDDDSAIQVMTTHVSKGLEFDVVFPIGLIAPIAIEDEEELSERMRQLYVALTRAKTRLYFPITPKEKTSSHNFLQKAALETNLEEFIREKPNFELACAPKNKQYTQSRLQLQNESTLAPSPPLTFSFPPSTLFSYTALAEKKVTFSHTTSLPPTLPTGAETGIVLHKLFERLNFQSHRKAMHDFALRELQNTSLEAHTEEIAEMLFAASHTPLAGKKSSFCLAEVAPNKMRREMEFLYPSTHPQGFIKGVIDLFFEHEGYFYSLDWKSNYLEEYTLEKLDEAMIAYDYKLQAKLYQQALYNYLKLFSLENNLESMFYLFLRGIHHPNKGLWVYHGK